MWGGGVERVHMLPSPSPNVDFYFFILFFLLQITPGFAQRLSSKVSELLAVMENGLMSADPRDCTTYTGWTGDDRITHLV